MTTSTGTSTDRTFFDQFRAATPGALHGAHPDRSDAPTPSFPSPAGPTARPLLSPQAGVRLVVGGLATVGTVVVVLLMTAPSPSPKPEITPATDPIMIEGFGVGNVQVEVRTYTPDQSSNWHRHSGMHAVAVISGTLTVYGPDCMSRRFAAGEAHVGGQELHLARNETDHPVELMVIYLFPGGQSVDGFTIPAAPPTGCGVA